MSYGVCVHFSHPLSWLLCTGISSAHIWSIVLMSEGRGLNSHNSFKQVESKAFRLINCPLTDCLDFLSHRRNAVCLSIFYRFFHADCSSELANCMPPFLLWPCCTRHSLLLIPILSIFLMQELTSIFTLSSLTLVNSGTLFYCLFFHLPMT